MARSHDRDATVLQWLAQRLERRARELRELVQKQHAIVGEHNLSDPSAPRAANQPCGCARVVTCPTRPLREQLAARELSGGAVNAHHFDRLRALERRQDRGKAPREHRLAGTGRPAENAVVGSGSCDKECADSLVLAANITQIGTVSKCARLRPARLGQPIADATAQYACRARE